MSAEKLADYAELYADPREIRKLADFRRWVAANAAALEKARIRVTPRVVEEAWRVLRSRRSHDSQSPRSNPRRSRKGNHE
jgi:hypothetical protein